MVHKVITGLAAVLVALALAGCGGDDSGDAEAFANQVGAAEQELERAVSELRSVASPSDVEAALDRAAETLRSRADDLANEDVPDDVQDEQQRLISAMNELADELEGLDRGDLTSVQSAATAVDPAVLDRARRALEDARNAVDS